MNAAVGYRTADPEVLAAWDEWQAEMQQQHERIRQAPRDLSARLKGMPDHAIVADRCAEPGAFKHDGAIYVYWSVVPDDVDGGVWEQLKLSALHAAHEAHDEQVAARRAE